MRDLFNNLLTILSLHIQALTDAAVGDAYVDLQGFQGALIQIFSGTITDGTSYEFELQESDNHVDFTAVADDDLLGEEPTFLAADSNKVKELGYIGSKQYLRVDLKTVLGGPSTGGVFGAAVVKGFARHASTR
ncbi:unnamed protein product [marine sediment metagenome]|uniref:PLAT domain-containing protein n=1 Tax=marine sediment metagenome TaxID=412755 RepID=X1T533_9ZZZZ